MDEKPIKIWTFKEYFKKNKWLFLFEFIFIFITLFGALYFAGYVPEDLKSYSLSGNSTFNGAEVLPVKIQIKAIGVDASVSNPESQDVSILDEWLKKGAVRYPDSGNLENGNMFIFGHSTGIAVVRNQAYKTFNNLKSLKEGDEIIVSSTDKDYIYKVKTVSLVDSDTALIRFDKKNHMLTLSSCNTFGKKQERYVVEADFVKSQNIGQI